MSPERAYSVAERERALQLADEQGAAAASRELSIPAATIRAWRHRSGQVKPPAGADPVAWSERKRRGAREAWETAQEALREVKRLLGAGKTADAQRAALTMAILTDKGGALEIAAANAAEREQAIAAENARRIVSVLEDFCRDLGIPWTLAVRRVLAAGLKGTTDAEAAEHARAEVREQIGRELADRAGAEPQREPLAGAGAPGRARGGGARADRASPEEGPGPPKCAKPKEKDDAERVEGEAL